MAAVCYNFNNRNNHGDTACCVLFDIPTKTQSYVSLNKLLIGQYMCTIAPILRYPGGESCLLMGTPKHCIPNILKQITKNSCIVCLCHGQTV